MALAALVVAATLAACGTEQAATVQTAATVPPQVLGRVLTREAAPAVPDAPLGPAVATPGTTAPPPAEAPPVVPPVPAAPPATLPAPAPVPPAPTLLPAAPRDVTATAGPGSVTVAFAEVAGATSYTVHASGGSTATGPSSPLTVVGLVAGARYSVTVAASNDSGTGPDSAATEPVVPAGPVTNTAPLAPGRRFVNQSVSFVSSAGTNSSRRPQATERPATSLFSPPVAGLPAGQEWRLLWLRARNCEAGVRRLEFFVVDEAKGAAVRKFVQDDAWVTGQPNREVAAGVAPGAQLTWTAPASSPLLLGPGQSVGARWYGMSGGSEACNWQFAAVQQPAGTGAEPFTAAAHPLPERALSPAGPAMRTSWLTVPAGAFWVAERVSAANCETGGREMEVMLLGPGAITMGTLTTAGNGTAPVTIGPGGTLAWSAADAGAAPIVLPAGWSLGVRWLGMTGDQPGPPCSWAATVAAGALAG